MNSMNRHRAAAPGYAQYRSHIDGMNIELGFEQQSRAVRRIKRMMVGTGVFVAFCIGSAMLMSV